MANIREFAKFLVLMAAYIGSISLILLCYIYSQTDGFRTYLASSTAIRAYDVGRMIDQFEQDHHALPGDFKDAAKVLPNCDASCAPPAKYAGDGVIGHKDFLQNFAPPPHDGETQLFWTHLERAGMYNGSSTTNSRFTLSGAHYAVGHANGAVLATHGSFGDAKSARQPLNGTVMVIYSDPVWSGTAKPDESNRQLFKPREAAAADMKMDDGQPLTGNVQAYGAPDCVEFQKTRENPQGKYFYKWDSEKTDCGLLLIVRHADEKSSTNGDQRGQ